MNFVIFEGVLRRGIDFHVTLTRSAVGLVQGNRCTAAVTDYIRNENQAKSFGILMLGKVVHVNCYFTGWL